MTFILIALWLLAPLSRFAGAQAKRPVLQTRPTDLGELPKGVRAFDLALSPNLMRWGAAVRTNTRIVAVVDGVRQEGFDWITDNTLTFTADSKHVIYIGKRFNQSALVIDGQAQPACQAIESWTVSSTGGRVGYAARKEANQVVAILDGVEGKPYEEINWRALIGTDGPAIYVATKDQKQCVVINGREGKWYDGIMFFGVSDDGRHVRYHARVERDWVLVIDEKESRPYQRLIVSAISPNGTRSAFWVKRDKDYFLVADGQEHGPFERPDADGSAPRPIFSPDGKRLAFVAHRKDKDLLFIDGKQQAEHSRIIPRDYTFSPDSAHFAYMAATRDGESVILDGAVWGNFERLATRLLFSPDGRHLAAIGLGERDTEVLLDGKRVGAGGLIGPPSLTFSADGTKLGWISREESGVRVYINGVGSTDFELISPLQQPYFDSAGRFHFLAVDKGRIMHVEAW